MKVSKPQNNLGSVETKFEVKKKKQLLRNEDMQKVQNMTRNENGV